MVALCTTLKLFLLPETSSGVLTAPGEIGIESVYCEVEYSDIDVSTQQKLELPTTTPDYEFQESIRGLQTVEAEESLWRVSGATVNQPALDQGVSVCSRMSVCERVCVRVYVCMCACECMTGLYAPH